MCWRINQKCDFTITDNMEDNSWLISKVDSNELGPVQPVQVDQSNMKIMKMRGPWEPSWLYQHKYSYSISFLNHVRSYLGLCVPGVTEGPKASKKTLAHLKDHLEYLGNPNDPWAIQDQKKKTGSFSDFK